MDLLIAWKVTVSPVRRERAGPLKARRVHAGCPCVHAKTRPLRCPALGLARFPPLGFAPHASFLARVPPCWGLRTHHVARIRPRAWFSVSLLAFASSRAEIELLPENSALCSLVAKKTPSVRHRICPGRSWLYVSSSLSLALSLPGCRHLDRCHSYYLPATRPLLLLCYVLPLDLAFHGVIQTPLFSINHIFEVSEGSDI